MHAISPQECSRIAQDLQIRKVQVESVVHLLDEGNTVPFIARYRKDRTSGLREEVLRQIQVRLNFLRQLQERKQTILKHIENQGKLTDELRQAIAHADTTRRLEDLYLPYKTKKRGLGAAARDKGLGPLALAVWHGDSAVGSLEEILPSLVNPEKQLGGVDDVRSGVGHIVAEMIAESADVRAPLRALLWETGKVCAGKSDKLPEGAGLDYKDYFAFTEPARQIPPHRILALNRGEKEQALQIRLDYPKEAVHETALGALAGLLLKQFGKMPPLPPPPATPAQPSDDASAPAETVAAVAPPPGSEPPAATGETPAASEEAANDQSQTPTEIWAPEGQAAAAGGEKPQADAPPLATPEATPLVASMAPQAPAEMTGEQLSPHVPFKTPHAGFFKTVLEDALTRLLLPSLEREIRHELTDEAEAHAVTVFARNLRSLLMQPPLHQRRVLALDPSLRGGCKLAALDEQGNLLEHATIYPFGPPPRRGKDKDKDKQNKTAAAPAATPAPAASNVTEAPPAEAVAPTEVVAPAPEAPTPDAAAANPEAAPAVPPPTADAEITPAMPAAPDETPAPVADSAPAASPAAEPTPVAESAPAAAPPAAPPPDHKADAKGKIRDLLTKHQISVIALGNGAGCRELEEMLAGLIASDLPDLAYVLVSEAGTSVYALSQLAREELPHQDVALRSAISIGRRLQDPLAELVKIDPQHIGVGLYQHDMSRKDLKESLENVVTSCVNQVGVDVNTAGVALLRHVAGLNPMAARELVEHRKQHGPFASREAVLQLASLGPQRAAQAVGFLRFPQAAHPLDRTWLHPESYPLVEQILSEAGAGMAALDDGAGREDLNGRLRALNVEETARKFNANPGVLADMIDELVQPGQDPRDELPPPVLKKGILRIEDLQPGMELKGTVLNVVDFGAFVDVGLKDSGLVHISQMANRYIKSPYDVVAVHDVVTCWVLTVDKERHRVSLTMIAPGTERKPQERRPAPRREEGGRPPRGRRPGGPPQGQQRPEGAPEDARGPRPPRGRHVPGRGPGPRGPHAPAAGGQGQPAGQGGPEGGGRGGPPPRPPLPPRRPRREPPKPKLSQAALEGKVPLRTFSELSALYAAKKDDKKPPTPASNSEPAAPATSEPPPAAAAHVEPAATTEAPPPAPATEHASEPAAEAPAAPQGPV
jgi:uncharacterized protein